MTEKDILHVNGNEYPLEAPYVELMKRRSSVIRLHMAELAMGITTKPLGERINEVLDEQ